MLLKSDVIVVEIYIYIMLPSVGLLRYKYNLTLEGLLLVSSILSTSKLLAGYSS